MKTTTWATIGKIMVVMSIVSVAFTIFAAQKQ